MTEKFLTRNFDNPDALTLKGYEASGGYTAARKAFGMEPTEIVSTVKESNLRGRGGAGFPTGVKWGFLPNDGRPRYLVVNADEGEPGTFKDRQLMERDPHQLIEGIIISSYAIGAHLAFIYIRGELVKAARILNRAIDEAESKGYLGNSCFGSGFNLKIIVHRGAGAYVCGEETALLQSIEGRRGEPRVKPPFPASEGLLRSPTIINNVETISCIPHIINMGGSAFAALGVAREGGTRIFSLSGHVAKPGLYELPVGFNLKSLIYEYGGGIRKGKKLKAVFPGGSSTPVLRDDEIDIPCSIDGVIAAGSMIGSGAVVVMDETTCMVRVAWRLARFYRHESCGQCTPCREGTWWLEQAFSRIEHGTGTMDDISIAKRACEGMAGTTLCPLGEAAAMGLSSYIKKFESEFVQHIKGNKCPYNNKFIANWEVA